MAIMGSTVDHTFHGLCSSFGQSVAAATLMVSIGKYFTPYYFIYMMLIICLVIGAFTYLDKISKKPHTNRGAFQNYVCSVYDQYTGREIESALYAIGEQQSKMLTAGTPKNQARIHRYNGSSSNLPGLESPRLNRKLRKQHNSSLQRL